MTCSDVPIPPPTSTVRSLEEASPSNQISLRAPFPGRIASVWQPTAGLMKSDYKRKMRESKRGKSIQRVGEPFPNAGKYHVHLCSGSIRPHFGAAFHQHPKTEASR